MLSMSRSPLSVSKVKQLLEDMENCGLGDTAIFLSDLRPMTRVWLVQQPASDEMIVIMSDPDAR